MPPILPALAPPRGDTNIGALQVCGHAPPPARRRVSCDARESCGDSVGLVFGADDGAAVDLSGRRERNHARRSGGFDGCVRRELYRRVPGVEADLNLLPERVEAVALD